MKLSSYLAALLAVASTTAVWSQEVRNDQTEYGIGLLMGYRALDLKGTTYAHNTHRDDMFLPNSDVPGSAGKTSIDGTSQYFLIGLRVQTKPIFDHFTLNFDAGALLGGKRDDHQNANDSRPPEIGAFVYSDDTYGMMGGIGLAYNWNRWSLGIQTEALGIVQDNGWDRWSSDETANTTWRWKFTAGPKVGFRFWKSARIEGGVQFGGRQPMLTISLSALSSGMED